MIVVAILGLAALIAVPTWAAAKNRSQRDICGRNRNLIYTQMTTYCKERDLECSLEVFSSLADVRSLLMPEEGKAYINRANVFCCPADIEQTMEVDYSLARNGRLIVGIWCDVQPDHN